MHSASSVPAEVVPAAASTLAHPPDPLLTTAEAARFLSVSEGFLRADRLKRTGRVPFVVLGRVRRYRRSVLIAVLDANTIGNGKEMRP